MNPTMLRPLAPVLAAAFAGAGAIAQSPDIRTSTSFIPLESAPVAMVAADGHTLLLCHENPLRVITYLPDPAGELREHATLNLPGNRFTRLAQADINHDHLPDLAILSSVDRLVHILINQGDGTFLPAAKSPYPTPILNNDAFGFGDLDNSGAPHLLVGALGGLVKYPNLGNGEFGFPAIIAPDVYAAQILVADFKATGQTQIAAVVGSNIRLLERIGDTYQTTLDRATNGNIFRMTAAPQLPDARTPILVARADSRTQTLTYDPGANNFTSLTSAIAASGAMLSDAAFADINTDGAPDLVLGYTDALQLSAAVSDAAAPGGYTRTPNIGLFQGLRQVAVLDLNADTLPDTVHATTNPPGLVTFLQHPEHAFRHHGTTASKPGELYRFLPINAPGEPPAFFLPRFTTAQDSTNQQAVILPGQPGPTIQTTDLPGPPPAPAHTRWTLADLNNDDHRDLIEIRRVPTTQLTSLQPHALFYHRSLGDGTYAPPAAVPFTAVYNLSTPVVADFDNDGIDDIAVMDAYGLVFIFLGSTDAQIAAPVQFQLIPPPSVTMDGAFGALMAADLDNDTHTDLVASNRQAHNAAVYIAYGLSNAQFEQPVSMPAPPNAGGQISPAQDTGDLNGDGILDIAITGADQAVVYMSEGPRNYAPALTVASDPAPHVLFITDFDADTRNELVLCFPGNTKVVRFEQGQPAPDPARFLSPRYVQAIHFADLNDDALPDMLIASEQGLSIIYNRTNPHTPCPADTNADGLLNFFDLAAYIALYNASDPAADLAAPFGALNFFDLAAFITLYNAGCP